ncbi:MaoC family dehydratase N-terminal domain-containing protein [Nocardioides sp. QY071]|uniref:FAS1-like dehydratase domain-containing protein n=1 Tax=Nocardioides sp. QY071 TaxID=3044187 RepID=UPI00249A07B0|nr:MaoC family dehydratase N-terminal domain-containing protein [Nocardioides sp. QY071]WGY00445.1 MaoC family dehydratase N-terminal domain-containing protein [Nocardioides sp. QY071]
MSTEPTSWIGRRLEGFDWEVTREAVGNFAHAVGESDPVYFDAEVARRRGLKNIPVPPTFLITLELDHRDSLLFIKELGLDAARVLHGEQSYDFHALVHVGDAIRVERTITDAGIKGNNMTYLLTSNNFYRGDELVAQSQCTWLVTSPGGSSGS